VSNAAFNNLGRPQYSTIVNWLRDGVILYPTILICAASFGAAGVIYGQAIAAMIAGVTAVIWGWRYVISLERAERPLDEAEALT
jgi:Na+-driven multidrug efflux pump